ncbi:DUF6932 family protein [Streptococcus pneumoniae]|uniref:DUF6932 family protein n=1 Tax=Streptococcus pneumoniae TaxID=1313 RepID=UPI003F6941B7
MPWASGLTLYVGGSLLSDKPCPGDIDCALVVPLERCSGVAASLMALGTSDTHTHLKNRYQVDFYIQIQIAGLGNDFSAFFQYIGEKTAAIKHLQQSDRRGIVRMTL